MKKISIIKTVALMLCVLFALSSAWACVRHVKDDPKPTADPSALATQSSSEDPGATAEASMEPVDTAEPDASEDPDMTADPGATQEAGANESPAASAAPAKTDAPSNTAQPSAGQTESDATPAPSQPSATTPASTPTPKPTATPLTPATPTPKPTNTPKPDPVTELTWMQPENTYYCDMDFDGKDEKIELNIKEKSDGKKSMTVKVTVGKSGNVLLDTFDIDSYVKGLINNFNTGDKRVEIALSTLTGTRDHVTRCYCLNDKSTGLLKSSQKGYIETVIGNKVNIHRYLDLFGTWECTAMFSFAADKFSFEMMDADWIVVPDSNRWCTVSEPFYAGVYSNGMENLAMLIDVGTKLYPTATDYRTRIDFTTDTGTKCYISIEIDPHDRAVFEGGDSFSDCFSDLTYMP